MFPFLFKIGNLPIYSYGILHLLAMIALALVSWAAFRRRGADPALAVDAAILYPYAMFLLAHWAYVLIRGDFSEGFRAFFLPTEGGLWGGLLFLVGGLALYARIRRFPLWEALDLWSPALLLSLAIGKVGCLLGGCCWGGPSGDFFGLHLSPECRYAHSPGPLHPVPLYDALWASLAFLLLLVIRRRASRHGTIFLLFLIFFASGRFLTEFLREGYVGRTPMGGLYASQLVELATVILATGLLGWRTYWGGKGSDEKGGGMRDAVLPAALVKARLWRRTAAYLLDTLWVALLPVLCLALEVRDPALLIGSGGLAFFVIQGLLPRTPGSCLLGIMHRDRFGRRVPIARRALRALLLPASLITIVGIIRPLGSRSGQAFHDMAGGVFVVNAE
ncbi:MAG: prolipoprotein diacylglyceryl transferase family protein [Planctomycetota bacterium]